MKRRSAIGATLIPLTAASIALPACGDRKASPKVEPPALPPFSPVSLHAQLDKLLAAYAAKSPKTQQYLQPGLTDAQIREQTAWFPKALPPEITSLYQWRNGFSAPKDADVVPFQFRDCTFLPLKDVEKEYRSMNGTYGRNPSDAGLLASAFPFAALGGGWLVVAATRQSLAPSLERPVISVFQGVSVFFYSMEKMAETCTAWLSHPAHNGFSIPPKLELEIWRQVNPGIFP
jgi:hypothetical protein